MSGDIRTERNEALTTFTDSMNAKKGGGDPCADPQHYKRVMDLWQRYVRLDTQASSVYEGSQRKRFLSTNLVASMPPSLAIALWRAATESRITPFANACPKP